MIAYELHVPVHIGIYHRSVESSVYVDVYDRNGFESNILYHKVHIT